MAFLTRCCRLRKADTHVLGPRSQTYRCQRTSICCYAQPGYGLFNKASPPAHCCTRMIQRRGSLAFVAWAAASSTRRCRSLLPWQSSWQSFCALCCLRPHESCRCRARLLLHTSTAACGYGRISALCRWQCWPHGVPGCGDHVRLHCWLFAESCIHAKHPITLLCAGGAALQQRILEHTKPVWARGAQHAPARQVCIYYATARLMLFCTSLGYLHVS